MFFHPQVLTFAGTLTTILPTNGKMVIQPPSLQGDQQFVL